MEYAYAVGFNESSGNYDVFKYVPDSDPVVIFQSENELSAIDYLLDLAELRKSNEEYFAIVA